MLAIIFPLKLRLIIPRCLYLKDMLSYLSRACVLFNDAVIG